MKMFHLSPVVVGSCTLKPFTLLPNRGEKEQNQNKDLYKGSNKIYMCFQFVICIHQSFATLIFYDVAFTLFTNSPWRPGQGNETTALN